MSDIEYEKAKQKYSVSHMSNAKWFKLFSSWAASEIKIDVSYWNFLDSDHVEEHALPQAHDLRPDRFEDGRFQPFEYKWILSISIPRRYRPVSDVGLEREQDIAALVSIADELGQFPLFDTESGIEIRGYET